MSKKKVPNLTVKRIENLLKEKFDNLIDLSDLPEITNAETKENCFLTRALVATAYMKMFGISETEAVKYITDGGGDGGIDGIFVNKESKTVTFLQSKFHHNGSGTVSKNELLAYFEGIENILNCEFEKFGDKINALKDELDLAINRDDYKFIVGLVYTGPKMDDVCNDCENFERLKKEIEELDQGQNMYMWKIISLEDLAPYIITNKFCESIDIPDLEIMYPNTFSEPQKVVFGVIEAKKLADIYKQYGNKVYSSNIRYFKGDTDVNDGMKKIIESEENENFIIFNNGIKAVCDSFSRLPKNRQSKTIGYFSVDNLKIVNGAQTTGTLALYNDEQLENINVFITLISTENSTVPDKLCQEITLYSNSQNKINSIDFASLDQFHSNLQNDLDLDGKKYIFKTGDEFIDSPNTITLQNLTVASGCYISVELSAKLKNGISKVFSNREKEPYTSFFNPNITKHFAWNIAKIYELTATTCKEEAVGKSSLEYTIPTHGINFISYEIFQLIKKNYTIKLDKSYISDLDKLKNEIKRLVPIIISKIEPLIIELYKDDIIANVFRTITKAETLSNRIDLTSESFSL